MASRTGDAIKRIKKKLNRLRAPMTSQNADDLAKLVIAEMKDLLNKGISTIKGVGRLPGYKAQQAQKKTKGGTKVGYPYSVQKKYPGKKDRPVNLYLTGHQHDSITHSKKSDRHGYFPEIGYLDEFAKLKEKGHREGAGGQPKRPTIPPHQQEFAQRILTLINRYYRQIIRDLTRK